MTVNETANPNGTITIEDGTAAAPVSPDNVIADSTCTRGGDRTIIVPKNMIINGHYNDTGWHYELANGVTLRKGALCNWVSGLDFNGRAVRGFTASIQGWGFADNSSLNLVNGGSVTWRNVRYQTRDGVRADFQIRSDDTTTYDIDGLEFTSDLGGSENNELIFEIGTIRNVYMPRCNMFLGGAGTVENTVFSGLGDSVGAENKIFTRTNNFVFVGLTPFIGSDGIRLASQFGSIPGTDAKSIFFDDTNLPTWWDWTTDLTLHNRPGTAFARYIFLINLISGGNNLNAVQVRVTNDNDDDSEELNGATSADGTLRGDERDGRMVVYEGSKTATDSTGYMVPTTFSDKQLKTILCRRADLDDLEFSINMSRSAFESTRVMSPDPAFTGTIAEAGALTGIDISAADTAITITEAHTMQDLYNYVKWYMAQTDNMQVESFMVRNGSQITFEDWTIVIDGVAFSASDAINNFVTGTVTLSNGGTVTGGYRDDSGTRAIIRTTPVSSLLRIEEYEDDGTTLTQTVKGTSDSDGNFGATVASDAKLRIYAKKWGYAFDRTDHDLDDGAEADVSLVLIPHIDPARDISAYVGESASSNEDKAYFDWDSDNDRGVWVGGEINTSNKFIITAALLDNRITTQDGLEFYAWFNVQSGIDSHLQGAPFSWNHDSLEINEDYMDFLRVGGMLGTAITRYGVNVKKKNGEDPYIAPISANSRVQFDNLAILVPRSTLDDITAETVEEIERDGGPLNEVHAKTEQLEFLGDDVKATLDGELVNSNYEHFFVADGIERHVYVYDRDKNRNRSLEWSFHEDHTDIESLSWKDGLWYGIHNPSSGTISVGVYSSHGVRQSRHEFDLPSDFTDVQCSFILGDDLYAMDNSGTTRTIRVINLNTRLENTGASIDVSSLVENPLGMDYFEGLIYIADSRNLVTATRKVVVVSLTGGHDIEQSFDMHAGTVLPTGIQVNAEHTFILDGTRDKIDTYDDSNTYVSASDIPLVASNSDARALSVVKSQVNDVAGLRAELQRLLDLQVADIEISSNSYVLKDSAGTTLYTFNRRSATVSSDWSGGRTRA